MHASRPCEVFFRVPCTSRLAGDVSSTLFGRHHLGYSVLATFVWGWQLSLASVPSVLCSFVSVWAPWVHRLLSPWLLSGAGMEITELSSGLLSEKNSLNPARTQLLLGYDTSTRQRGMYQHIRAHTRMCAVLSGCTVCLSTVQRTYRLLCL